MISIEDLSVNFEGGHGSHLAVNHVSLEVGSGKFYTLLGPSGCGKTTTLRCVAGLQKPNAGRIVVGNQSVVDMASQYWVPPHERGIGMVFQSYAIWPHMNVFENVAFPLRRMRPRIAEAEIRKRVLASLDLVHLDGLDRRPATDLSGGQQQRLALARALVGEPQVLLLDEPLSNLDAKLREGMRYELKALTKRLGVTTLFVTHEQVEALTMSDSIAVMRAGEIIQQGPPAEIYAAPRDPFVADFVGRTNLIKGVVQGSERIQDRLYYGVQTSIGTIVSHAAQAPAIGSAVTLAIRPENIELADSASVTSHNHFEGEVAQISFMGNLCECLINVGALALKVQMHPVDVPQTGATAKLQINPMNCQILAH